MAREHVKPRVEPSPTLRLITQATMGATLWWSELGPQLGELPHLRVCLEGHVTYLGSIVEPDSPESSFKRSFITVRPGWLWHRAIIGTLCRSMKKSRFGTLNQPHWLIMACIFPGHSILPLLGHKRRQNRYHAPMPDVWHFFAK